MSLSYMEEVQCSCGETFEAELYQSVSVRENPELKEAVLGGQLNVVKCTSCFRLLYAERFVLYHDADSALMAFVYPKDMEHDRIKIEQSMGGAFAQLQSELPEGQEIQYQPYLLFGMDALCALIRAEEDLADEVAVVESLCDSLQIKYKKISLDLARRKQIPSLIPYAVNDSKNGFRENAIAGLLKVMEANPHLQHYGKFLAEVNKDPEWSLDP